MPSDKFRNKFRIDSHRKADWDYSNSTCYFLTLVTQARICNLGNIGNDELAVSDFGAIMRNEWYQSFEIRKELILHAFVIMPNHLHAIVEIRNEENTNQVEDTGLKNVGNPTEEKIKGQDNGELDNVETKNGERENRELDNGETHGRASLQRENNKLTNIKRNMPRRMPRSISSFLAGFKSAVNTQIDNLIDEQGLNVPKFNKANPFFQANYHDHIIRDAQEYDLIFNYILNNPSNWNSDSLNT